MLQFRFMEKTILTNCKLFPAKEKTNYKLLHQKAKILHEKKKGNQRMATQGRTFDHSSSSGEEERCGCSWCPTSRAAFVHFHQETCALRGRFWSSPTVRHGRHVH
jgi:hypothetical protein